MNVTVYKAKPKDQVKIRNHQYVPPTLNNPVRMIRDPHNRKRVSLPPPIKEEDEEDEEDIPLAILAYRKGFITPDSLPLQHKRYSDPSFYMTQNNLFYQLYNSSSSSSSSSSSLSLNELATKKSQYVPGTEPKFYRQYSSGK